MGKLIYAILLIGVLSACSQWEQYETHCVQERDQPGTNLEDWVVVEDSVCEKELDDVEWFTAPYGKFHLGDVAYVTTDSPDVRVPVVPQPHTTKNTSTPTTTTNKPPAPTTTINNKIEVKVPAIRTQIQKPPGKK